MSKNKKLIILFGPSIIGRMVIGEELSRRLHYGFITDRYLVELLVQSLGTADNKTLFDILEVLVKSFENSNKEGFIISITWSLSSVFDRERLKEILSSAKNSIDKVCFAEISTSDDIRMSAYSDKRKLYQEELNKLDKENFMQILVDKYTSLDIISMMCDKFKL